jgi:hypothetical protein
MESLLEEIVIFSNRECKKCREQEFDEKIFL